MKKNLASILITNYNKEKFIKKSVISALSQSYNLKEVILFDDKSTDNSLKKINRIKNIKILKNKSIKSYSSPINQINGIIKSFQKSNGEYIFFLDSDDKFKKNKLKKMIELFKKNNQLKIIQDKPFLQKKNKVMNLKKKKHIFSIWPSIYPTSCIALRKKYFTKFLKFVEKNKYPNLEIDSRLVIYAFLNNDLKILNRSYTIYNYDNIGISSNYKKFSSNWWKKRNEAFNYMQFLTKKLKLKFRIGPDYLITKLTNLFIYSEV